MHRDSRSSRKRVAEWLRRASAPGRSGSPDESEQDAPAGNATPQGHAATDWG